ncbi:MAG: hypothetical protein ACI4AK_05150 [Lepagella sp.]
MNRTVKLMLSALAMLMMLTAFAGKPDPAMRRKAKYYYNAAIRSEIAKNHYAAHELYRKAFLTDTTFDEAALGYGRYMLINIFDSVGNPDCLQKACRLMRKYIDANPDDAREAIIYCNVLRLSEDSTSEDVDVLERAYRHNPDNTDLLDALEYAYAIHEDYPMAIDVLRRYERLKGVNHSISTRKAQCYMMMGDTISAFSVMDSLVSAEPYNMLSYMMRAAFYQESANLDSAICDYRRAEKINPDSGQPKYGLAMCYQELGDSITYDSLMVEVMKAEDIGVSDKINCMRSYVISNLRDEDRKRTDDMMDVLLKQYPYDADVLEFAAVYAAVKPDLKAAEEYISYAIDVDPSKEERWLNLIYYQMQNNAPERAIESYQRSRKYIPDSQGLRRACAIVYAQNKEYQKSNDLFVEIIKSIQPTLRPDSIITRKDIRRDISYEDLELLLMSLNSIADNYHSLGQMEDCYRTFENVLSIDPGYHEAANNYAYFLANNGGDLDKALELSRKSLTGSDRDYYVYLDTYAWILFKLGRYEEALESIEKAINGEDPMRDKELTYDIYDHYGSILLALDRKDEAYRAWEIAIKLMEQNNETDSPDYAAIIARMKEIEKDVLTINETAAPSSTDADVLSELNDVVEKMVK